MSLSCACHAPQTLWGWTFTKNSAILVTNYKQELQMIHEPVVNLTLTHPTRASSNPSATLTQRWLMQRLLVVTSMQGARHGRTRESPASGCETRIWTAWIAVACRRVASSHHDGVVGTPSWCAAVQVTLPQRTHVGGVVPDVELKAARCVGWAGGATACVAQCVRRCCAWWRVHSHSPQTEGGLGGWNQEQGPLRGRWGHDHGVGCATKDPACWWCRRRGWECAAASRKTQGISWKQRQGCVACPVQLVETETKQKNNNNNTKGRCDHGTSKVREVKVPTPPIERRYTLNRQVTKETKSQTTSGKKRTDTWPLARLRFVDSANVTGWYG